MVGGLTCLGIAGTFLRLFIYRKCPIPGGKTGQLVVHLPGMAGIPGPEGGLWCSLRTEMLLCGFRSSPPLMRVSRASVIPVFWYSQGGTLPFPYTCQCLLQKDRFR